MSPATTQPQGVSGIPCLLGTCLLSFILADTQGYQFLDLQRSLDGLFAASSSHEITSLPGFNGTFPSRHYGGYITVDKDRGRNLFYYFIESERDPRADPVVLWLNGGPGCSSFDGWMFEHGPFNFEFENPVDKTGAGRFSVIQRGSSLDSVFKSITKPGRLRLSINNYSWSKEASMLYVDSPAGVGLSYSETKEDYRTNDTHTAQDLNAFLRAFFTRYDAFSKLDFYISDPTWGQLGKVITRLPHEGGRERRESYAGIYVPTLAKAVLAGNEARQQPRINLKGYLIGNGVTDAGFDGNAVVDFSYFKSLIGADLFLLVFNECKGVYWKPPIPGSKCEMFLNLVVDRISRLNEYDILWPCYDGNVAKTSSLHEAVMQLPMSVRRQWPFWPVVPIGHVASWPHLLGEEFGLTPPCLDHRELNAWLDQGSVRQALHAAPESVTGRFQECTTRINYTHDTGLSMVSTHLLLNLKGLRALIYSGDHDMNVPHPGSEAWTRSLGYDIEDYWRPWLVDKQVAGYMQKYKAPSPKGKGLIYATVLGAGHFVPETRPAQAFAMFSRFLADQPL